MTPELLALNTEIVTILYASNRRSLVAAIIVAILLLFIQHHWVSNHLITLWVVIFLIAYSARLFITHQYYSQALKSHQVQMWLNRFRGSTSLCGLVWGLASILLFPGADTGHQIFLIFVLVGVAGGAMVVYSIDTLCSNLFIGGVLVLMVPQFLIHGDHLAIAFVGLAIVYVIYVRIAGHGLAKNLHKNIALRVELNIDNKKVHQLAYYDVLTNLPNRRMLSNCLNQSFVKCQRTLSYGAVLFLDLNNFKSLNDTKGHMAGDALLQQVAHRLKEALNKKAMVARVGGDEFVVLLDALGRDKVAAVNSAYTMAEKLIQAISQPFKLRNFQYHTTPSIGICLFFGQEFDETEVLRRADLAMYQAKQAQSINGVQLYDEERHLVIELRATLENDLSFALNGRQFVLYYQLQVDQDQVPIGAEVLLRWNHPTLGFISPTEFIAIAETSGVIVSIGNWVLTQACQQLKQWAHSSVTDYLTLSVNVSALQFSQPDFAEVVMNAVQASGCNPSLLKLELTESMIVNNVDDVISKIHTLKSIGIKFSLDDFGIGQSSLSILSKLPLDEIKIDKSFIQDILQNNYDKVIVQTIISMGRLLGCHVIAEGVELKQQKNLLERLGCNAYQGFLFCRPLSLEVFEAKLCDNSFFDN